MRHRLYIKRFAVICMLGFLAPGLGGCQNLQKNIQSRMQSFVAGINTSQHSQNRTAIGGESRLTSRPRTYEGGAVTVYPLEGAVAREWRESKSGFSTKHSGSSYHDPAVTVYSLDNNSPAMPGAYEQTSLASGNEKTTPRDGTGQAVSNGPPTGKRNRLGFFEQRAARTMQDRHSKGQLSDYGRNAGTYSKNSGAAGDDDTAAPSSVPDESTIQSNDSHKNSNAGRLLTAP
jgi:hypothetical protein